MSFAQNWEWKFDMNHLVCINDKHQVFVKLFRDGNDIKGKVLHISMDLFRKIAGLENGPEIIQQIILAAKDEYWRKRSYMEYESVSLSAGNLAGT